MAAGETLSSENMGVFPGGKGLNQSVALSKAGAQVIHGAVIGNNGELLLETLSGAGVDISRIEKKNESCGHAIIQVDKTGQNCILLFSGTNGRVDRAYVEKFLSDAEENDILLLQNEVSHLDIIFEVAHSKKCRSLLTPHRFTRISRNCHCHTLRGGFAMRSRARHCSAVTIPKKLPKPLLVSLLTATSFSHWGKRAVYSSMPTPI